MFRQYAEGDNPASRARPLLGRAGEHLLEGYTSGAMCGSHCRDGTLVLQERKLPTVPSLSVLDVAFAIATAFDRTVDDALYVALAVHSKAQLITADERLANALAAHLPVKWLGAI